MIGPELRAAMAMAAGRLHAVLKYADKFGRECDVDGSDEDDVEADDELDASLYRAHALLATLAGVNVEREAMPLPSMLDMRRAADFLRLHKAFPMVQRWIEDGCLI